MESIELQGVKYYQSDEYTTEQVEAFCGVIADAGLEEILYKVIPSEDGKKKKVKISTWLSPILKQIHKSGLLHNVAACCIAEENCDYSPEAITDRAEKLRKLPFRITWKAVISFLSFVFGCIMSSRESIQAFRLGREEIAKA